MHIHGYPWISTDIHGYPWILDIHVYLRYAYVYMKFMISLDIHGGSMDSHGWPWISVGIHGYPLVSMDIHGYPWISMKSMDIIQSLMRMPSHGHPYVSIDVHRNTIRAMTKPKA